MNRKPLHSSMLALMDEHNISYTEYEHDPIRTYEDALRIGEALWRAGVESKSVFLKAKDGTFLIYVTQMWTNVDVKMLKELTGKRYSIAKGDDMSSVIDCVPWCVAPFGYELEWLVTVVDESIFAIDGYLMSPWDPSVTLQCEPSLLKPIFEAIPGVMFV